MRQDNAYTDCPPFPPDNGPSCVFAGLVALPRTRPYHDLPRACLFLRCVPSRLPVRPMQARAIWPQPEQAVAVRPWRLRGKPHPQRQVQGWSQRQFPISVAPFTFIAAKPPWYPPFNPLLILHALHLVCCRLCCLQLSWTSCPRSFHVLFLAHRVSRYRKRLHRGIWSDLL